MNLKHFAPVWRTVSAMLLMAALAGCQGAPKAKPAELPPNVALMGVRQAWAVQLPAVSFPLVANVVGETVTVAGSDGTVAAIDARSGAERWRTNVGKPLAAGVGSDGSLVAVVTKANELVALRDGKLLWRRDLGAESYTSPLVAGQRVFVQSADRTTSAWDGQSGRRLWSQTRTSDNLVLRKPGVLLAMGDTLITGIGGRLVGINPENGSSRWELPIAAPRGTNDVERLVDLTGPASRIGDNVCVRAYYAAVGCADLGRGGLLWSRPASGSEGLTGNADTLYGTEANGVVMAWRRGDGERIWSVDRYKYRRLTSPLAAGRTLVFGDDSGLLHFLSREDGSALTRVSPDGSAIAAAPILAGGTVVVVTRKGGVFGYRPE